MTVTATAGSATAQIPVLIIGSTVTASTTASTLADNGSSPATLTITAKDSAGVPVASVPVTFTITGTGNVTLTPSSGTTDINGQVVVSVAGSAIGTPTVTARALGASAATTYTVTATAATFSIDQTTNTTTGVVTANPTTVSMKIGEALVVRASAPTSATVTFATTLGSLNGAGNSVTVAVAGGTASATLTTTQAGIATVQAFDPLAVTNSDSIAVSMTAVTAGIISLQATPSVVAKSVGTTTGVSTLIATVTSASGLPVGDAPVIFSIVNPTGGGETVTPVVVFTSTVAGNGLSLGQAKATFTSGSISSPTGGVRIRATVLGTAVATEAVGTDLTASGPDVSVVIGGTAGSVAFGTATTLSEANNGANYVQAMSVLVADSNGNPAPAGTVVNLSAWPIAWSTGTGCFPDTNTTNRGTFLNEDVNENLILDTGEDGGRLYYDTGTNMSTNAAGGAVTAAAGTANGFATPPASAAGLVPGTVTTDANGVASFNLTYGKSNALWIVTRLRARTVVQGTEAVSEIQFRLPATEEDAKLPDVCRLPNSPNFF